MVAAAFTAMAAGARAGDVPEEPNQTFGPRLDVLIWSEELDRSKALTEIIAGNADTIFFDIKSSADKERALGSDQVDTFPAYGLFDELTLNPATTNTSASPPTKNPFAIREVREAMQYLIDRDFVVRDIYAGYAIPYKTPFHPRSPEYGRNIASFLKLEDEYAFNPEKGKAQMTAALNAAGWVKGSWTDPDGNTCGSAPNPDPCWRDGPAPDGRVANIIGLKRIQDERLQLGGYYESILRGLGFKVTGQGVTGGGIAYGQPPDQNLWHYYTAGWIATSITAWDDSQLQFYATGGAGEPFFNPAYDPNHYEAPQELQDIANTLAFGQYSGLEQRSQLIANGTELAMKEAVRIFIDARESLWVNNIRMDQIVWDLFGGNSNPWGVKAATVPTDTSGPYTGLRVGRLLNFQMFQDGWNPWLFPGWLYDSVQRRAMMDLPMAAHPHTGRYMDFRNNATVQTAGPSGTLAVPTDAMLFNTTTNAWQTVTTGTLATSKVTLDMVYGNWHHGVPITVEDVLYAFSNLFRRATGDITAVPGIDNAASDIETLYVTDYLKGIKVVDANTLEVYLNYWHADDQEIAAFASIFPSAPWEVQELGTELLLDQIAVSHDSDASSTGRIWLDLTKGDSMPPLVSELANKTAANWIPPGMSTVPGGIGSIDATEATARWAALNTWYTTYGHFWPSNGPFYLETVDTVNRQTIMKAFRTGYPFQDNHWDALTTVAIPSVNFAPTPPVVFAETPAIFDFTVYVGPTPTDDFDGSWFLRDTATGEFLMEKMPPSRLGTGSYRIEINATTTKELLLGNFEVITVVTGWHAAVPTIRRSGFLVLPSTEWFEALLDARADLIEGDLADLGSDLDDVAADLDSLSSSTSGLTGLVTAMAILAVIAVVIALVSVMLVMRKGKAPPKPAEEKPPEEAEKPEET